MGGTAKFGWGLDSDGPRGVGSVTNTIITLAHPSQSLPGVSFSCLENFELERH